MSKKHNMENELASEYLSSIYENSNVTIEYAKTNEELGITVFETSDGKIWFSDNNDTFEIKKYINPYCIKYDDRKGWINEDGTVIE